MRISGISALLVGSLVASASAGEPMAVPVKESTFRLPPGGPLRGPLPRSVLLIHLNEQGKTFDNPSAQSFWVYDSGEPEKGARLLHRVPGDDACLGIDTPLFGGWGIAHGELKPGDENKGLFWFNLITGGQGEDLRDHPIDGRFDGSGWTYLNPAPENDGPPHYEIVRRELPDGKRRELDLLAGNIRWMNEATLLATMDSPDGKRLLRVNWRDATQSIIAPLPDELTAQGGDDLDIHPAGPDGAEGYYVVGNFSLHYLPSGGNLGKSDWKRVIHDVNVVKTFGGAFPWLPVEYLGGGRFAVAKTVRNSIPVPDSWSEEDRYFGAAEAVTMLLDSDGRVLETTKGYAYNHNPPLRVPAAWRKLPRPGGAGKPAPVAPPQIRVDEKKSIVVFADGKRERIAEDERCEVSDDGRSLVVFQDAPERKQGATTVDLRVFDGASGEPRRIRLSSEFHKVLVDCSWHTLCSRTPEPGVLTRFGRDRNGD